MFSRLDYSAPNNLIITLGLFGLMQTLISYGQYVLTDEKLSTSINFIRQKRDNSLVIQQVKPPKPSNPQIAPPKPTISLGDAPKVSLEAFSIPSVPINPSLGIDNGFGLGTGEGDYLPIMRVAPQYPKIAFTQGVEGWVIVEFTITPQGSIATP